METFNLTSSFRLLFWPHGFINCLGVCVWGLGENRLFGCVNVMIYFDQKTAMVCVGFSTNDLGSGRGPLKTAHVDLNNSVMELFSAEIQHLRTVVSCYHNELYSFQLIAVL
jgi:hypothetical protein